MTPAGTEQQQIYQRRFRDTADYRNRVWKILTRDFFARWIPPSSSVLDLGCGYGEFINNIVAKAKFGMDLNPDSAGHLAGDVTLFRQDCSEQWPLEDASLDVIFASNFFEHLPNKEALARTVAEAFRCLKPGACLIAMGPNVRYLNGSYWDFFDHHTILTEKSLSELLEVSGFDIESAISRFLPYTLQGGPEYPLSALRLYLNIPLLWRLFGRQFLVVARR